MKRSELFRPFSFLSVVQICKRNRSFFNSLRLAPQAKSALASPFPGFFKHKMCCMKFVGSGYKSLPMQTNSSSNSTSTVLIVLVLLFTFPIWIGIAAGIFGAVIGLFGAAIGIVAGVFGAVIGAIGGVFGWIFDWDHDWPFAFFWNVKLIVITMIIVVLILVTRSRKI